MFHVIHQPAVEISKPTGGAMTLALVQAFEAGSPETWSALLSAEVGDWKDNFLAQYAMTGDESPSEALPIEALQFGINEAWRRSVEIISEEHVASGITDFLVAKAQSLERLSNSYALKIYQNIPSSVGARIADQQRKLTLEVAGRLRGLAGS